MKRLAQCPSRSDQAVGIPGLAQLYPFPRTFYVSSAEKPDLTHSLGQEFSDSSLFPASRNLLQMQTLQLRPKPTESETRFGAQPLGLSQAIQVIVKQAGCPTWSHMES